ncbi:propionyl-CoA synthetase [Propylenella binzhouense]|uniref:Propionyl-CoA synthetase n=1 Tax=Propylenella binzhouense TaxID=2555902 RepID=A0A964T445_9HYPH|nr:propionyl-CoA synthetase [Propylenella binzhouense]MYZ48136.1 propionyl-CoA synthetase [Propylenella binzhouense]
MTSRYHEVYAAWRADPEAFWVEAAREIDWFRPWDRVFDPDLGIYGRWFAGAECNTCHNCVDRHAARRPDEAAIIYDSPVTGTVRTITYGDLLGEVSALAAVLLDNGIGKGDRVILYMPMVPEAIVAMLACARIGAIHSVVFGGFAAHELATRIDDCRPKLIVSASCGIEPGRIVPYKPLLDGAIARAAHKPERCLILQRPEHGCELLPGRDLDYAQAVALARGRAVPCAALKATDPLYILYTSGTTGQPKGVVRDNGGHMVALKWSMAAIYAVDPGEVFWAASDVGWVVGHSYIVYAPLLHGCTTVLYEGKPVGTPDAGAFWRVIAEHRVAALFTAPTAFRAIKKEDPGGTHVRNHDLSGFRTLFLAGERADPDTIQWAERILGVPVVDHWWQTETAWAIAANPVGLGMLPVRYGSPTVAMPGYDVEVLSDAGEPVAPGTLGNIAVRLPLPPGCLPTLWNADQRFSDGYLSEFPGFYKTADAGFRDEDGYLFVMARTDDIINVAGHRLSTGAIEEVLASHPDVAECAVIGIADELKGQLPCGFVVLKSGKARNPAEIERECVGRVRAEIGPVAALKTVFVVDRLPKTRSGKILRATMRQIADGEKVRVPPTIDDPAILDEIRETMGRHGRPPSPPDD